MEWRVSTWPSGPISYLCSLVQGVARWPTETLSPPKTKAPSRDMVQWLGSKTSLETTAQYDYVFCRPNQPRQRTVWPCFGRRSASPSAYYLSAACSAFLIRGGVEWERFDFNRSDDAFIPQNLHVVNAYLAMDFRFSYKDMVRIQSRPGLYSGL